MKAVFHSENEAMATGCPMCGEFAICGGQCAHCGVPVPRIPSIRHHPLCPVNVGPVNAACDCPKVADEPLTVEVK